MNLFLPRPDEISAIQEREQRWYFSAAADVVLRRHGVVTNERNAQPSGFVGRQTPWRDEFADRPLVFEGPVHESVLEHFGVRADDHDAESLSTRVADGRAPSRLSYPQPRPAVRDRAAEVPVESTDPKWDVRTFIYQEFLGEGHASPVLLGGEDFDRLGRVIGVRVGPAILLGVPILDLMARTDAMPPYARGYSGLEGRYDITDLEVWLVEVAEALLVAHGQVAWRLRRWPHPFTWAITIRHDVDRPLHLPARTLPPFGKLRYRREIRRRLLLYRHLGLRSTWFWLRSTAHGETMRRVVSEGHEIGLHTEAPSLEDLRAELAAVSAACGEPVAGMSAHGAEEAPGHLGTHHLEWAAAAELEYGERIGGGYFVGPAITLEDGSPSSMPMMLPGQHIGIETGTHRRDTNIDRATAWLNRVIEKGGHAVVMNHPDVHYRTLRTLLGARHDDAWSATLADVCRWARSVQGAVRTEADHVEFRCPLPEQALLVVSASDAVKEIVLPAGTTSIDVKDLG